MSRGSRLSWARADRWRLRWLVQEIRLLPGSETSLHHRLPVELRADVPLRLPDYARADSARALLTGWEGMQSVFTSRYHASLIGAWMGARTAVFARNDKVAGAIRQLGLATVAKLDDPSAILRVIREAHPVERRLLLDVAEEVREACGSFFAMTLSSPPRPASAAVPDAAGPPRRLLFLRPDAYGDLCLFEPVLRIVRDAWPAD